jgi:hypothetical protein
MLVVCVLASLATAKPRAKRPRGKAKPPPTAPAPAPVAAPEPPPVVTPVVTPAPAPAPVAAVGKPRVAVVGDPVIAKPFRAAIESRVELVATGDGSPVALAAEHGLHAVIVVSSPSAGQGLAIVYQGSDGAELGRSEIAGGRFVVGKKLGPEVVAKLGGKLASATAPAPRATGLAIEPSPSSSHGVASESANRAVATVRRPPRSQRTIVLSVEERPFWRRLRYNDDLDDRLRPSDLVANAVGVGASWRPLQNLRNFSIVGRGELAVGVNGSRTSDGTAYSTSSSEWGLGVGFDIGIAAARIGVVATYGEQRFTVDDDPMMELVPDVTYRFARGGLVVAVPLAARWDLTITAGWRQLLGMGGMTESMWFPRATGAGIDGSAGVALHVTPWLDVQARVDVRRYFFAMNPEPGDPWIAGGATDQYVGGALGLAISPR